MPGKEVVHGECHPDSFSEQLHEPIHPQVGACWEEYLQCVQGSWMARNICHSTVMPAMPTNQKGTSSMSLCVCVCPVHIAKAIS